MAREHRHDRHNIVYPRNDGEWAVPELTSFLRPLPVSGESEKCYYPQIFKSTLRPCWFSVCIRNNENSEVDFCYPYGQFYSSCWVTSESCNRFLGLLATNFRGIPAKHCKNRKIWNNTVEKSFVAFNVFHPHEFEYTVFFNGKQENNKWQRQSVGDGVGQVAIPIESSWLESGGRTV